MAMGARKATCYGGLVLLGLAAGCGTTKVSGTQRTATEQLLLTNAWDDALRQVDFRPLAGVPVYLETQYATSPIDQGWMISSIRQAMLAQGVLLRPKLEQAQWIVEARVGTYGTNDSNWLFGVPQVTVPPTVTGVPAGTVPEIPIAKKNKQQGVVKLALYAYDRATGQVVWTSGTRLATSSAKDVYLGGFGPIQSGSIRDKPEVAGWRLPRLRGAAPNAGPAATPAREPAGLPLPSAIEDRGSFEP